MMNLPPRKASPAVRPAPVAQTPGPSAWRAPPHRPPPQRWLPRWPPRRRLCQGSHGGPGRQTSWLSSWKSPPGGTPHWECTWVRCWSWLASGSGRRRTAAHGRESGAPWGRQVAGVRRGRCCWLARGGLPPPLGAAGRRHRRRCWTWTGRRGSRTCGCTPGGRGGTTGSGNACAPRSEDSGRAGPERPCREAAARGRGMDGEFGGRGV